MPSRRPPKPSPTAVPLAAGAPASVPQTSTRRIVDAISAAIVERRLMPGTKLAEQALADIFEVSRTVVRQALNQLSRDRLVDLTPSRGAFVRQPSLDEARQVFEVRAMLESAMLRSLCRQITPAQIALLERHLDDEAAAIARADVPGRTRLLADFHSLLAGMLGNQVLAELLRDLLSRSSLISLMYQSAHSAEHSQSGHRAIVEALSRRDAAGAVRQMQAHLGSVERHLRLHPRVTDLASALQPESQPA